jgi:DNA polymerase III subunit alpha, Gram-positive type
VSSLSENQKGLKRLWMEADLPSEWLGTHFREAEIREVRVHPRKRSWQIRMNLPEPIAPEIWEGFINRVRERFQPDIHVSFQFEYDRVQHEIVLQKYKHFIQKLIQEHVTPAAATWFGQAEWRVDHDRIEIVFSNPAVLAMARQRELDRHVARFYSRITGR